MRSKPDTRVDISDGVGDIAKSLIVVAGRIGDFRDLEASLDLANTKLNLADITAEEHRAVTVAIEAMRPGLQEKNFQLIKGRLESAARDTEIDSILEVAQEDLDHKRLTEAQLTQLNQVGNARKAFLMSQV